MKEAFGGILNIVFIVIFLLIVSGTLAFTVTYTKAFKMKNYIITNIENFEGRKDCFSSSKGEKYSCSYEIFSKAESIGYSKTNITCPDNYLVGGGGLFCYCSLIKSSSGEGEKCDTTNTVNGNKYRIITQVNIDIPIIKDAFGHSFFQVTGDTKYMK